MSFTLAVGRPTIADRILRRSLATDLVLIVAGTALTAGAAQLSIPMWPVPITGQTFAVLLVGTALGPVRGALSMALYLVLGVVGLPIFTGAASGSLIGMTSGGYIVGFVFAAALVGALAQREWDRRVLGTLVSFLAGTVVIYAFGLPWLYVTLATFPDAVLTQYFGTTDLVQATLTGGLYPFLLGDAAKALVAAALLPLGWRLVRAVERDDS
ncbi:MAG: biotin transporter BioY [Microbacteriaceae bacterium]